MPIVLKKTSVFGEEERGGGKHREMGVAGGGAGGRGRVVVKPNRPPRSKNSSIFL